MIATEKSIIQQLQQVKQASRQLVQLSNEQIQTILQELAALTEANIDFLLVENQKDLDRMDKANPKYDRLLLNEERLKAIANDLRKVAGLLSPLAKVLENRTLDNGLDITRISVPIGVISIIYESRPNVTFDVFALCLKSGNAVVLKGSRDAHFSNLAIVQLIHQVLAKYDLKNVCYLAPSERAALPVILQAVDYIDLAIPRGGQGLINFVRDTAKVPVIETGAGIVHTYFDKTGDVEKAKAIITNAKARRVSVCNALDTLVIHEDRLEDLPLLLHDLYHTHECEMYADEAAFAVLAPIFGTAHLYKAQEADFGIEFLSMKMSIKTVANLPHAIAHISEYTSKHSEAIIAEDENTIDTFIKSIDAAVVYANTSTAFTDGGQFGLGAEIGISTQKLHARGPMALRELTSYKWVVKGNGQVR